MFFNPSVTEIEESKLVEVVQVTVRYQDWVPLDRLRVPFL